MLINKERFLEIAEKNGIDVLVAATRENVLYSTEYWSLSHWTSTDVQVYAVLPVEPTLKATLVAPMSDVDLVTDQLRQVEKVVPYGNFYYETVSPENEMPSRLHGLAFQTERAASPFEALVTALKAGGFEEARIGVDEGTHHPDLFEEVKRLLPRADLLPANSIFAQIRMVKTEQEIDRIRQAANITERAMMAALSIASEGRTEKAMATEFEKALVSEGARPDFTVLAFAERTALPNAIPSERALGKGDPIRFDIGCIHRYYRSDTSRMAVFGEPSEKLWRNYQAILRGQEKGLEMIKPGVRISDIFVEIVKMTRESGLPAFKRHHCGHGIGLEGYERPSVSPSSQGVLENGMVLCIEPPYYELGWGGVQVEDTLVVRADGAELLTSTSRDLIVI